jgi:hypothetical protein
LTKKGTLGAGPGRNTPGLLDARLLSRGGGGALSGAPLHSGLVNLFLYTANLGPFRAFDSLRLDEGARLSGGPLVSWAKA